MQITVTKNHLVKALSTPDWSASTCLVATAISEAIGKPVVCGVSEVCDAENKEFATVCQVGAHLIVAFDQVKLSGAKQELPALENRLPCTITLTYLDPSKDPSLQ